MAHTEADKRQKRLAEFIEPFRVRPGSRVTLGKAFDPSFKAGVKKKKDGVKLLAEGVEQLAEYQARLAAQGTHGVVVVLQALDAAGARYGNQPRHRGVDTWRGGHGFRLNHASPCALAAPEARLRQGAAQPSR